MLLWDQHTISAEPTTMFLESTHDPSRTWEALIPLVAPTKGIPTNSNAPITRDDHSKSRVNHQTNMHKHKNKKEKARNKWFNDARQLTYNLGVEWRRCYSNNWVTRVTNWSGDPNWEFTQISRRIPITNPKTLKYSSPLSKRLRSMGITPFYIAKESTKKKKPTDLNSDQKRIQNPTRKYQASRISQLVQLINRLLHANRELGRSL